MFQFYPTISNIDIAKDMSIYFTEETEFNLTMRTEAYPLSVAKLLIYYSKYYRSIFINNEEVFLEKNEFFFRLTMGGVVSRFSTDYGGWFPDFRRTMGVQGSF